MTWGWNYSPQTVAEITEAVRSVKPSRLREAWAEIQIFENPGLTFDHDYDDLLLHAESCSDDVIADAVVDFAESQEECSNGGWTAYYCPYECHGVRVPG